MGLWTQITGIAVLLAAGTRVEAQAQVMVDARPIAPDRGAAGVWEALNKLHTRASLLMIVAHPDDEDGATLAYESRGLGARVELLTLDRGEGGANVMSADYWDALGLVRTEELLQAGRYYGLDGQYFTTLADYGFSKSLDEALKQWGHDRVLEQAVRVVREVRPLVVCSVFVGGPTDGHGQHAVAGLMAQEVFNAAGDPKMFPEQIKAGLRAWTPVKTYGRAPFFRTSAKGMYDYANHTWGPVGVTNHVTGKWEPGKPAVTVNIPNGTFAPVTGLGYNEISREGLGFQRSQNGGPNVPLPGPQSSDYHRFGTRVEAKAEEDGFFDGMDTSLPSIALLADGAAQAKLKAGLERVDALVGQAMKDFRAQEPAMIAPGLAEAAKLLDGLAREVDSSSMTAEAKYNVLHELRVKRQQCNTAMVAALGIALNTDVSEAAAGDAAMAAFRGTRPTFQMATAGMAFQVKTHLYAAKADGLRLESLKVVGTSGKDWKISGGAGAMVPEKALETDFRVQVPVDEPYTRPYFVRAGLEDAFYKTTAGKADNAAFAPYPLQAEAELSFQGARISLTSVVQVVKESNGPGVQRLPMPVGPALSVAMLPAAGIVPLASKSVAVSVKVHSNAAGAVHAVARLAVPEGWRASPAEIPVAFAHADEEQVVSFAVVPQVEDGKAYQLTAVVEAGGSKFAEGYVTTGYSGLRPYFLYSPASAKLTGTDVKVVPGMAVAYIEGSGDDVPAALEQMGVRVSYLSAQDLAAAELKKFDAIVLGVRAYAVRPDVIANNGRLLEYVKNGGVMIVQYNTPEYDHNYGPFPYVMSGDPEEVTDESSRVEILEPRNPVFTWPNRITAKDFDGWIEERGSKFLQTWDPRYTALLETHDAGQPPQQGGLMYARYGKGVYIYNAYAFYRQLPLGVPGAFRLFANMLSLPRNPAMKQAQ